MLDAAREVFVAHGSPTRASPTSWSAPGPAWAACTTTSAARASCTWRCGRSTPSAQEEAASQAVAKARRSGVTDPFELFTIGARAYLEGSWERRDLAMLFVSGDTPPGFEMMRRHRGHEWISQNDALLRLSDNSFDRLYATVLTSLIGEGAREVALAKNRRQANTVIGAVIEYARRLMADGPWKPPVRRPRRGHWLGSRRSGPSPETYSPETLLAVIRRRLARLRGFA